jgi:hypothetical protein
VPAVTRGMRMVTTRNVATALAMATGSKFQSKSA